jgi:hypothetical protein
MRKRLNVFNVNILMCDSEIIDRWCIQTMTLRQNLTELEQVMLSDQTTEKFPLIRR